MVKEQKSKLSGLLGESQEQTRERIGSHYRRCKTIINGSGTIESKIQSLYKQLGEVSSISESIFRRMLAIGSYYQEQKKGSWTWTF